MEFVVWSSLPRLDSIASGLSGDAAENVKKMKKRDPVRWRSICLAMRTQAKFSRTSETREQVRQYVEELVAELKMSRKRTCMLLTHRQYVAWLALHEGASREDAMLRWNQDLRDPNVYKETEQGVQYVGVNAPTEISTEESVAKRRCVGIRTDGLDGAAYKEGMVRALQPSGHAKLFGSAGIKGLDALRPAPSPGVRQIDMMRPLIFNWSDRCTCCVN